MNVYQIHAVQHLVIFIGNLNWAEMNYKDVFNEYVAFGSHLG